MPLLVQVALLVLAAAMLRPVTLAMSHSPQAQPPVVALAPYRFLLALVMQLRAGPSLSQLAAPLRPRGLRVPALCENSDHRFSQNPTGKRRAKNSKGGGAARDPPNALGVPLTGDRCSGRRGAVPAQAGEKPSKWAWA